MLNKTQEDLATNVDAKIKDTNESYNWQLSSDASTV